MKKHNRREFIQRTGCAAIGMAAASAGFKKLGLMNLYAQNAIAQSTTAGGYKALVCIFLGGGNDSNNMVVPVDSGYTAYSAVRGPSGLALGNNGAPGDLLPINPISIGHFGFHPAMPELVNLFNLGKLAVVCNVGTLVQPTTRTTFRNGTAKRPYQLFSHSDQQEIFQTGDASSRIASGWGGRMADRVVSLNSGSGFPVVTSVAGSAVFGQGLSTRPLTISTGALNQVLVLSGFNATPASVARRSAFDFLRTIDRNATLIAAASDGTDESINIMGDLTTDPTLTTVFPNSGLGNQLKQVAKVMKLNQTSSSLNLQRQIFFTSIGGFDTHQNEIASHTSLYTQLSTAMNAFYNATQELGIGSQVTTFFLSDFGRTFQPSGSGKGTVGSDHAWGSHLFVMGDAVKGGDFYGTPGSNGTVFPSLILQGPDDTDQRGRWCPTSAVDQYAATLGAWFGLQAADYPIVFPLLSNFPTQNLGFI
jgi:uncharacterized protein (DUF1501 family)